MWSPGGTLAESPWRHEQQAHAATVSAGRSEHHGRLVTPGRADSLVSTARVRPAGHALNITSREQTQAKVRPTGASATRISGYRRDNLRADSGVIDLRPELALLRAPGGPLGCRREAACGSLSR